jgi:excisionase family DNA binding protein
VKAPESVITDMTVLDKHLLTLKEAAEAFNVSVSHLKRGIRYGTLTYIKLGTRTYNDYRLTRDSVIAWLHQNEENKT